MAAARAIASRSFFGCGGQMLEKERPGPRQIARADRSQDGEVLAAGLLDLGWGEAREVGVLMHAPQAVLLADRLEEEAVLRPGGQGLVEMRVDPEPFLRRGPSGRLGQEAEMGVA